MTPAAQAVLDAVRDDRLTPEIQRAYRIECAAAKEESMGETDVGAASMRDPTIDEWWEDIRVVGLTAAHRACVERAIRAHERARIVAWLRNDMSPSVQMAANAIEAGEHEVQP